MADGRLFEYMKDNRQIRATGFVHWILGSADLDKPVEMPTYLPYVFSDPDEHGRVPFPDVVLASGYEWAMHPRNSYPLHLFRNNNPHISNEEAVARCMLWPFLHANYGAQRFASQSNEDHDRGTVLTHHWRESIARYLFKESGIQVSWSGDPPTINVIRNLEMDTPNASAWNMTDVDPYDDGRAQRLDVGAQSSLALLAIFGPLQTVTWAQRLFKLYEL